MISAAWHTFSGWTHQAPMPSLAGQKILLWAVESFRQLQSAGWRIVQPRLDATLDLFLPLISPGKMIALEGEKAVPLSLIWMLPDVFRVISWEELIAEDPGFHRESYNAKSQANLVSSVAHEVLASVQAFR
ncbi:hypothetical protein C8J56DRAFT_1168070 [Mycena floridula]|nr:hypothetical protein C8J56DRAFT_1168070 [Mycena floridula]